MQNIAFRICVDAWCEAIKQRAFYKSNKTIEQYAAEYAPNITLVELEAVRSCFNLDEVKRQIGELK